MTAAIRHRGPDAGGVTPLGACVLGHRRLSIIDLVTGDQPVTNEAGDVTAVFNGELYDFQELRAGLDARGHAVRGTGDTPVIPHLYEERGPELASELTGMFALAIWDARHDRLVLARDRVGKKPLLYATLPDGGLAFASELKALLQVPGLERELSPAALDAFLALQYVPGPATAVRGVHKVPPGHVLTWQDGHVTVTPYWTLAPEPGEHTDEEWLELVRERVRAAVRRRLISDVPLGALLSGGIDSAIVVGLMAEASTEPIRTFTVGWDDPRYDERGAAALVAGAFGTRHEELTVELDPVELVSTLAWTVDEPLGDEAVLPTLLISRLARERVTVALTGDGGDESFAGYERYRAIGLASAVGRVPVLPGLAAAALRRLPVARREPRSLPHRAARLLEAASADRAARYGRLVQVTSPAARAALYTPELAAAVGTPRDAATLLGAPPGPGVSGLQCLDAATYLPGDLLPKADLASMAASLELRAPLLDHRVLTLGVSLPEHLLADRRQGKIALRRAFADLLPPSTLGRRKTGFGVPIGAWFRGELRELAGDVLTGRAARERGLFRPEAVERILTEHASGRRDHGHRLWCLLVLELWQRCWLDPVPAPSTPTEAAIAVGTPA